MGGTGRPSAAWGAKGALTLESLQLGLVPAPSLSAALGELLKVSVLRFLDLQAGSRPRHRHLSAEEGHRRSEMPPAGGEWPELPALLRRSLLLVCSSNCVARHRRF